MKTLLKIAMVSGVGLILLLASCYIFQTGHIIQANNLIKTGKFMLDNGFVENTDLQIEASNLASLRGMEEEIEQLNFVQTTQVEYISIDRRNLSLNK